MYLKNVYDDYAINNFVNGSMKCIQNGSANLQEQVDDQSMARKLCQIITDDELSLTSCQFKLCTEEILDTKHKLIIFDRMRPSSGQLKYTDESYDEKNCLFTIDMNKFFKVFNESLNQLYKLIIISPDKSNEYRLDFVLDNLRHLEIYNCVIANNEILKSPQLENLYCELVNFRNCAFKFSVRKLGHLTISSKYIMSVLKSIREIVCLEIKDTTIFLPIELNLEIRIIKIKSSSLLFAIDVCKQLKSIKQFEVILTRKTEDLSKLEEMLTDRGKLKFFISGVQVDGDSLSVFGPLYDCLMDHLKFESDQIDLVIDRPKLFDKFESFDKMFRNFYSLIDSLHFKGRLWINNNIFNKLKNVQKIVINLTYARCHDSDAILDSIVWSYFPELRHLEICPSVGFRSPNMRLNNEFLKAIPVYCKKIHYLRLLCWNDDWSTGFISRLKCLRYLMVTSQQAVKNRNFTRTIKSLNHLAFFSFIFEKPENGYFKEDLSEFKTKTNHMIKDELNYKADFSIKMHYPESLVYKVIRYTYERIHLMDRQFRYKYLNDYNKLLSAIATSTVDKQSRSEKMNREQLIEGQQKEKTNKAKKKNKKKKSKKSK